MVNVCNNGKIPDFVHRKLGEVDGFLKKIRMDGNEFVILMFVLLLHMSKVLIWKK